MAVKVIGFDADDTLWVNENYFREAEKEFCKIMEKHLSEEEVMKLLYEIEMETLDIYGFGIKGFVLSMIETANRVLKDKITPEIISNILSIGKAMLHKPVQLLDDVEDILKKLKPDYRLILVTKGDLLDQERKLAKSGIDHYFHHIEIMSNKKEKDYRKLIKHLDIQPEEFLMVGNSLKSDILPVVAMGGNAIYVPYEITWMHETVTTEETEKHSYAQVSRLAEVVEHL